MSRLHHGPHSFRVGDKIKVVSGSFTRNAYPGIVDRVTKTQVHVTYDASSTAGRPAIKLVFWGSSGMEVGAFGGGRRLMKKEG